MTLGSAAAAQVRLIGAGNAATKSNPTPPRWLLGTEPKRPCSIARAAGMFRYGSRQHEGNRVRIGPCSYGYPCSYG